MKATKIRMKSGYQKSENPREIDSIYLEEAEIFYKKETAYAHLKKSKINLCKYLSLSIFTANCQRTR